MRVGSFKDRQRAQALVDRLNVAGLEAAASEPVTINGSTLYQVLVEPEPDLHKAQALLPRVSEATGLTGQVLRYP